MDDAQREFGGRFARAVIDEDFEAARALLAPWLQPEYSAERLGAWVDESREELPYPGAFELDSNISTLADLREPHDVDLPTQPIPDEVDDDNFRKWMCIQFQPEDDDEFDACFDMWLVAVEQDGELRIGYFESTWPD
jgi:hypothetical protein